MRVIGLMSGTSVDGIDAALCEISGSGSDLEVRVLHFRCFDFEEEVRQRILRACANEADVREVAQLNVALGEIFGAAAKSLIDEFGTVDLIGSHGQTIAHLPDSGATLQIGEPAIIAARTGTSVVADFRPRDLAEGGQGAPLVPYFDWVLLRSATRDRVILNIGGIGNCTILPAGCSLNQVRAWDTGPGNMVIDEGARRLFGVPYDTNGGLAAQGTSRLDDLGIFHPFFALQPPKSAGREEFGAAFAADLFGQIADPYDAMTTATHLTARSIADSITQFSGFSGSFELIVSGGGVGNKVLMRMLRDELPRAKVLALEDVGIDSNAKEALAFAILAAETVRGVATNVPSVTGATRPVVLGKITPA